ncbi:amidase family protein [Roseomonas sp. GC11]|uniref:amidase n=1 Tax=Roseomonas sp. GC11 TaxID=2950546 RepID=UPI00210D610E|nr:amidase family protein [Roseomonas sp. GC11]MCQ4159860.1 amidase family protein [Roseomonas sp. GC11]
MDDTDLCFAPATTLAAMIRARTLSPTEVVEAVLARIAAREPQLNAFAHLAAGEAREAARQAEAALVAGAPLGPLHGIPVTIKDHEAVRGMPVEYGTHLRRGDVAAADNAMVARLRAAGAIILGKTTTPEFGWTGVSRSPLTGITHNPWQHGYNAGASSAGAGVAAAAGYGPLHQGSDGAGSIRMPAHFCGVYGLKPSYGRVPQSPMTASDQTVHLGPLTRTVRDAALMLKVMAGPHPDDQSSLEAPPADYPALLAQRPRRPRIAYSADLGHARVDPEVAALVQRAVRAFEQDLGLPVEEVATPWGPRGPDLARFFWPAHFSRHAERLPEWRDKMDPGFVACIEAGQHITLAEYQKMRLVKYAYCTEIHHFFEEWDFLLTPAVSVAAFPADRLQPPHWPQHPWDWMSWAEFSYPFNLSQNPAASIPCGFTAAGLPVGLQIVGRRFDDLGVLQMSAAFEAARPWAMHRPPEVAGAVPSEAALPL